MSPAACSALLMQVRLQARSKTVPLRSGPSYQVIVYDAMNSLDSSSHISGANSVPLGGVRKAHAWLRPVAQPSEAGPTEVVRRCILHT
jgi:hypothetical protein